MLTNLHDFRKGGPPPTHEFDHAVFDRIFKYDELVVARESCAVFDQSEPKIGEDSFSNST